MNLRKVLPSAPWEIQEFNKWRPISDEMAKFLLENERQTVMKALENLERIYSGTDARRDSEEDISEPKG